MDIYHSVGENKSIWKIAIGDTHVSHIFEFYLSDNYSIEHVRRVIEDALIKESRRLESGPCTFCDQYPK